MSSTSFGMKRFVQLDANNNVVAELESGRPPIGANIVEVTTRIGETFAGKTYDRATDTFTAPVDPRPLADVLLYDPADATKTMKLEWMVKEPIQIEVTLKDANGKTVTGLSGTFGIPIMRYDAVMQRFAGVVRRLKFDLVAGVASRTFDGFTESGDYGIDDRVSPIARIAAPLIITVME